VRAKFGLVEQGAKLVGVLGLDRDKAVLCAGVANDLRIAGDVLDQCRNDSHADAVVTRAHDQAARCRFCPPMRMRRTLS